ncbi:MAG: hypothetical protein ACLU37_11080 [Collinsella sp.]
MFIASRNQVDMDEMGAGYVSSWDQTRFAADIKKVADEVGYTGPYYLCRDHGGPWQRDEERNAHLPEDEAMELARKSFVADMEAGFDLLMVDPTKDPIRSARLFRSTWCFAARSILSTTLSSTVASITCPRSPEVGTEETNGGLTSTDKYEEFISQLQPELEKRGCPMPTFIVGQTGTLTRWTEQVGHYNFQNARELADMAKRYGVGLKSTTPTIWMTQRCSRTSGSRDGLQCRPSVRHRGDPRLPQALRYRADSGRQRPVRRSLRPVSHAAGQGYQDRALAQVDDRRRRQPAG